MLQQLDLVKHWGVSKARISQLVKLGCPLDSLESADEWRNSRAPNKRPPTNGRREFAAEKSEPGKKGGKKLKAREPSKTGDSLLDALNNAIAVADGAFEDYEDARVNQRATRSVRLSEHSKALDCRLKIEKAYREEQERRGILVNKHESFEMTRRCVEAMLRRLKKLPGERGPQCNPQDPIMAVEILQAEVNAIMVAGQEALDALK